MSTKTLERLTSLASSSAAARPPHAPAPEQHQLAVAVHVERRVRRESQPQRRRIVVEEHGQRQTKRAVQPQPRRDAGIGAREVHVALAGARSAARSRRNTSECRCSASGAISGTRRTTPRRYIANSVSTIG